MNRWKYVLPLLYFIKQEAQLMLWNARAPHVYCALPELTKHIIIIYRCSRSIKYFNLLHWSVIASGGRNQRAKFGCRALNTFRNIGLRIWKRFCVIQANGVSNIDQNWRGYVEYNQLLKFGAFLSSRSGDIGPKKIEKNVY